MKQENKDLLLQDLSARLPYGVKMYAGEDLAMTLKEIDYEGFCECWENEDFKCHSRLMLPYLRPMSSMTKKEKEEMHNLLSPEGTAIYENDGIALPINHCGEFVPYEFMNRIIQYLLKNHFDFMNLIPKGLAIEITEVNNPYKHE